MAYSVLLVEDSVQICEGIVDFFFGKAGDDYKFTVVHDGDEAIALKEEFDIVLLDIMLPGASGFDVCCNIRRRSDCPIIFLTALRTEDNILKGYDLGADDYITKPFSLEQLFAKTQAVLKRSYRDDNRQKRIVIDEMEVDLVGMRIYVGGKEVVTTAKEFFILRVLLLNRGMVLTRQQILFAVWGYDYDGSDRVVDTHIKNLRRVLGASGAHIKTAIGRGYKIL